MNGTFIQQLLMVQNATPEAAFLVYHYKTQAHCTRLSLDLELYFKALPALK